MRNTVSKSWAQAVVNCVVDSVQQYVLPTAPASRHIFCVHNYPHLSVSSPGLFPALIHPIISRLVSVRDVVMPTIHSTYKKQVQNNKLNLILL